MFTWQAACHVPTAASPCVSSLAHRTTSWLYHCGLLVKSHGTMRGSTSAAWHAHAWAVRVDARHAYLVVCRSLQGWGGRCGANNSSICADVVPEELRSTVYAFDRSFEGGVAASAAPLVGEAQPSCMPPLDRSVGVGLVHQFGCFLRFPTCVCASTLHCGTGSWVCVWIAWSCPVYSMGFDACAPSGAACSVLLCAGVARMAGRGSLRTDQSAHVAWQ